MGEQGVAPDDEISLLDLLIVLAKHKLFLVEFPFIIGIFASAISYVLPIIFTASMTILPPQQSASAASALLGQLGGILGGASGALRNPSDLYVGILKSRTVGERLISRFALQEVYETERMSDTLGALMGNSKFNVGKDGLIKIEVSDESAKRSADIANAYYEELVKLTQTLAVTEASQRRLFFEKQVALVRNNLAAAEIAAKQGMERGGLAKVDDQGRAMLEMSARLRAQISAKEVQIGAMRTFAAAENPQMVQAQQELIVLRRELSHLEGVTPADASVTQSGKVDSQGLANLQRLREVKYHETIYELLIRQLELARIDEAKDTSVIQILDAAVEPDKRSSPKRTLLVTLSVLVAIFLSLIIIFILEAIQKAKLDQSQAGRLAMLRKYMGSSSKKIKEF